MDVSVDGGRNWQTARLDEPVLPKSLTRFYYEWDWDGSPALLQSRAIDETGDVQPTMKAPPLQRLSAIRPGQRLEQLPTRAIGKRSRFRLAVRQLATIRSS